MAQAEGHRGWSGPPWPLRGLAVLGIATACAAPPAEDPPRLTGPQLVDEMVHALGERRLFEGRLAGGETADFPWAPCEPVEPDLEALLTPPGTVQPGDLLPEPACSQLPAAGSPEAEDLFALGSYFAQPPAADAPPSLHRAHGLWLLFHGELDRAVTRLETAVSVPMEVSATGEGVGSAPDAVERAKAWNDLAVVYLVRAQRQDRPRDLAFAWQAAETAVALWTEGEAPRFNRALLRSTWAVTAQAREAWEELLTEATDAADPWHQEAQQRLAAQERPTLRQRWVERVSELHAAAASGDAETVRAVVAELPLYSRGYAQNRLLSAWGKAEEAGDPAATEHLQLARALGHALLELDRDAMVADAVAAIDAASPAVRGQLAAGHAAYGDGVDREDVHSESCGAYRRSRDLLQAAGSPFWQRSELDVGIFCESFEHVAASSRHFDALHELVEEARHPALAGRIRWMQTMSDYRAGRLEAARRHAVETLRLFRVTGDADVGEPSSLLAQSARALGRHDEAARYHLAALRSVETLGNPTSRHNVLSTAIRGALDEGLETIALVLLDEQTVAAEAAGDSLLAASNSHHASQIYARRGDTAAALAALDGGEAVVRELEDSERRSRALHDFDFYRGRVLATAEPERALPHLERARTAYQRFGDQRRLPEVHLLEARAALALGRGESAQPAYDRALALMETQRTEPLAEELRISLYETFQDAVDEMVAFHAGPGGNPDRAFEVAERAKGRALLDGVQAGRQELDTELTGGYPQPVTLEDVAATLPARTTLVHFAVLPERTLVWRVQDGAWQHHALPQPAAEMRRRVERAREQLESGIGDVESSELAALFDDLVRPWVGGVETGRTLLVVPDRALHRLPFAALWDAATGRHLVERHPVALAPSASVLLAALERAETSRPARGSLLALGAGAPPGLPPLPGAEAEVQRLGELYPAARVLTGPRASRRAFFEEARGHRVVHVAAHAEYVDADPLLSSLALNEGWGGGGGAAQKGAARNGAAPNSAAAGANADRFGRIYAHEIYGMELSGVELVVLSACRSTDGDGREGVAGWTRAFLAAGVPRVVAGLWQLDDAVGPLLMERFHRQLRAGSTPAAALQAAQVAMLRGENGEAPRPVEDWAGVQVFGY